MINLTPIVNDKAINWLLSMASEYAKLDEFKFAPKCTIHFGCIDYIVLEADVEYIESIFHSIKR